MSKSGTRGARSREGEPHRPAWRVKLRHLIEEASSRLEDEEKEYHNKGNTK